MFEIKKIITVVLLCISSYVIAQPTSFLPPEQAFKISGELTQEGLELTFEAAPGYYLYQESMSIHPEGKEAKDLKPESYPKAHEKFDGNFNKIVRTYFGKVQIKYPAQSLPQSSPLRLSVTVQGCAEKGICYPPITRRLTILEYGKVIPSESMEEGPEIIKETTSWQDLWSSRNDVSALSRILQTTSLPLLLGIFFLFGIGLAFTPCMLPMLPILSSVIFGTHEHHRMAKSKTLSLAIAYILGMATSFSFAGMATAWFGAGISAYLQNPWVLIAFGCLMITFAISLLGFYEIHLPHAWQARIDHLIGKQQGGSYIGVFFLGALSTLVASPCVTAPLAGILTFIAQSGQVQLGGVILFVMALGMGFPLFLFALGASNALPKAGPWMIRVQRVMGIIMLTLAIWLMLPGVHSLYTNDSKSQREIGGLSYQIVRTPEEFNAALSKPDEEQSIVTFYADWCVSCKELDTATLADPQVVQALQRYRLIEVDLTHMGEDQRKLLEQFKLFGPPAILVFDSNKKRYPRKDSLDLLHRNMCWKC